MNRLALCLALLALAALTPAAAEDAAKPAEPLAAKAELSIPEGARAGPGFDVERATQAWIETLPADKRAKSDAYFEGGYWLQLFSFLYALGLAFVFLPLRLSARLRDFAARITQRPAGVTAIYAALYVAAVSVLGFPLSWYSDFYREHQYGMANQDFGAWFGEQLIGLGLALVIGLLILSTLYAIFRRTGGRAFVLGSVVGIAFLAFFSVVAPVWIAPLFNAYKPLPEGPLRTRILSIAHASGVPASEVYWFDASKQTKRISANVSGFGPTTRISLNDNLLNRSPAESIESVMGHELGHYVLNHSYEFFVYNSVILVVGFAWMGWGFRRVAARYGERWGITGIADPAGAPLLLVLFTVYNFALTPVVNSIVRSNEVEADRFGLAASNQPDGFAAVAMQLSEYRKISPGYWEEILFYDHPSGANRVRAAMQWKKEHLPPAAGAAP